MREYQDLIKLIHAVVFRPTPPRAILLYGPAGTGKSTFARAVARARGCPVFTYTMTSDTMPYDFLYTVITAPEIKYIPSKTLLSACVIFIDELGKAKSRTINALNTPLHDSIITTPTGETFKLRDDVVWVLATNSPLFDASESLLSAPFVSRLSAIYRMPVIYDIIMTPEEFESTLTEEFRRLFSVKPRCVDRISRERRLISELSKILKVINEGAVSARIAVKMGQRAIVAPSVTIATLVGLGYGADAQRLLPYIIAPFTTPLSKKDDLIELARAAISESGADFSFLESFDLDNCSFFDSHSRKSGASASSTNLQAGALHGNIRGGQAVYGGVGVGRSMRASATAGHARSIISAVAARVSALAQSWGLPPGDVGQEVLEYGIRRLLAISGTKIEEVLQMPPSRRLLQYKRLMANLDLKDPVDVARLIALTLIMFPELDEFISERGSLFARAGEEEARPAPVGDLVPRLLAVAPEPALLYHEGAQEIYVLVDKSWSMSQSIGDSDNYSIAVALLASLVMSAENALYTISVFDVNVHVVAERAEWPWSYLQSLAHVKPSGGTCYTCAIEWASREAPDGATIFIIGDFMDYGEAVRPWQNLRWYLVPSAVRNPQYLEYLRNVLDAEVIDVFTR